MRVVIQRVSHASVTIGGSLKSSIGQGLLILLGVCDEDSVEDVEWLVKKIANLRIFNDKNEVMNRSIIDVNGEALVVSQFTLYANVKSRRPGFSDAARPDIAIPLYERVITECRTRGFNVKTGRFGADMQVESVNDGPVTIIIDSP